MTRAVVFKTKGKLDLRSITTFGLNAKPETESPIGYFGTGLKYAIAVLAREKIPVTFWIDGKKWEVETLNSSFRGKEFSELWLMNPRTMWEKRVKLPFTTELGKNWGLWQAFRELEANTRDEKGTSYPYSWEEAGYIQGERGRTLIVVESEAFVQEFFDKEKTFLKDGLTQREGTESIQVFDSPSKSIYYRGIRIFDLPEKKHSILTYNILAPIELTEDRTAKSSYDLNWKIQNWIAEHAPGDIIEKVLTAPEGAIERELYFDYTTPSKTFIEALAYTPRAKMHYRASQASDKYLPKKEEPKKGVHWIEELIYWLENPLDSHILRVVKEHSKDLVEILIQVKLTPFDIPGIPLTPGEDYTATIVSAKDSEDGSPANQTIINADEVTFTATEGKIEPIAVFLSGKKEDDDEIPF